MAYDSPGVNGERDKYHIFSVEFAQSVIGCGGGPPMQTIDAGCPGVSHPRRTHNSWSRLGWTPLLWAERCWMWVGKRYG